MHRHDVPDTFVAEGHGLFNLQCSLHICVAQRCGSDPDEELILARYRDRNLIDHNFLQLLMVLAKSLVSCVPGGWSCGDFGALQDPTDRPSSTSE